jgi:hypothetical protein
MAIGLTGGMHGFARFDNRFEALENDSLVIWAQLLKELLCSIDAALLFLFEELGTQLGELKVPHAPILRVLSSLDHAGFDEAIGKLRHRTGANMHRVGQI